MANLAELIYSRENDHAFDVISQLFLKHIYGHLGSFKPASLLCPLCTGRFSAEQFSLNESAFYAIL